MIDILKSIGVEKGRPFDPDAKTQDILTSAAREAHALLEIKYEGMFKPYFEISHWALPAMPDYLRASSDGFSDPTAYPVDSRGLAFTFAFFTPKHLGQGQSYLMTLKDKDGQSFDGREQLSTERARRMCQSTNIGRRACMTALRMPLSATRPDPAASRKALAYK